MLKFVALLLAAPACDAMQMRLLRRPLPVRRAGPPVCELELSLPSQLEAEKMGIRDWPETVVSKNTAQQGVLDDECDAGAMRYVLEGTGTVETEAGDRIEVAPNSLIEVKDAGSLVWSVGDDCNEMILLTPEYRGPPIALVAAVFVAMCAALVATAGLG